MKILNKIRDVCYDVNCRIYHGLKLDKRKRGMATRARQKRIFVIAGVSLPVFNFLFFWIPTNINSILMAFETTVNGKVGYGWNNFKTLIDELQNPYSEMFEALKNTFLFFIFNNLVSLPLAVVMSYFIYKKILGYKVFRYVFYLPSILSGVVTSSIVLFMAGADGPITIVWEKLFGTAPMFFHDSRYALSSIMVYGIWSGLGSSMIFYMAAMKRLPEEVIEAAAVDGVGSFREFFQIVLPMIWPIIGVFLLMGFIGIFNASGPILLFTRGEYGTQTLAYWIYAKTMGIGGRNLPYAAAVGLFFTLIGTPLSLLIRKLVNRIEPVEY